MLSVNQVAGFFKLKYLKKEMMDQIDFLLVDKHSFLQFVVDSVSEQQFSCCR